MVEQLLEARQAGKAHRKEGLQRDAAVHHKRGLDIIHTPGAKVLQIAVHRITETLVGERSAGPISAPFVAMHPLVRESRLMLRRPHDCYQNELDVVWRSLMKPTGVAAQLVEGSDKEQWSEEKANWQRQGQTAGPDAGGPCRWDQRHYS